MKRALGLALAAVMVMATTAGAADLSGREPVARAGATEDGFILPLRGAFDVLFVESCFPGDAPITASILGMNVDVSLESGAPVRLDLEPGPYAVTVQPVEGTSCWWAFFLDPR